MEQVNDTVVCLDEGNSPQGDLSEVMEHATNVIGAAEYRKRAYRVYIQERYGFLGPGNRVRIPHCITREIRRQWCDEDGAYMGFKER